jgi:hypothetical protein
VDEAIGIVDQLMPGAADYIPAGELQSLVAATVILEGGDRGMGTTVVGFDDQAGFTPEKIGFDLTVTEREGCIYLRWAHAGFPAESKEPALELPSRPLVARIVIGHCATDPGYPAPAAVTRDGLPKLDEIEDAQYFRLGDRVPQLPRVANRRKVDQGASEGRARDSRDDRPVPRVQGAITVGVDPGRGSAATIRRRHVNPPTPVWLQTPEGRRGAMRQHGLRPASQDSRQESPVS